MLRVVVVLLVAFCASTARATWSIVVVDTATKEIAVASATCLTGFDLQFNLPGILVDVGGMCAQSFVDVDAINRMRALEEMKNGKSPQEILDILAQFDPGHQTRQYGIVDILGRTATFTGSQAGAHASGVTGHFGSIAYAIQGNVLTGAPVVLQAELALINTPGDLPEKLMAAMEAARAMGGDGRCSCSSIGPPLCGSPPNDGNFEKAADVGFMIVTRTGNTTGVCTSQAGCANGSYYMDFNIAFQSTTDPDPVLQLRQEFDIWRTGLVGVPDAVRSAASFDREWIRADGQDQSMLTVTVRDWQNTSTTEGIVFITLEHTNESDQRSLPSKLVGIGNGVFQAEVGSAELAGFDEFTVRTELLSGAVTIIPLPTLRVVATEDVDADGEVDLVDGAALANCLTGPAVATGAGCDDTDFDHNGFVDLGDIAAFQLGYTNESCEQLAIFRQPPRKNLCVGESAVLVVGVDADPNPSFQWRLNGVPIEGATDFGYQIVAAQPEDEGYYDVLVTNTCGTITSEAAAVRVFTGDCP